MVNPGPSMRQLRLQESKKKNCSNKRSHPADIREGVATAVMLVKEVSVFKIHIIILLQIIMLINKYYTNFVNYVN